MAFKKDLNEDPTEEKVSRLNSAGIINITLENLWRDSYSALAKGDLVLWNRKLDAVWVLLGGDVVEGDDNDVKMKTIDMKIYKTGSLNHKKSGFNSRFSDDEATNMSLQYLYLKEKSLFLRRLQNSQGKGTAYANEDDSDFD
jgi:hypothetical protein